MKNKMIKQTFLILVLLTSLLTTAGSQITMTFSAGVSPQQTPESHYIFVNRSTPRDEFTFDLAQIKSSYFVGVGAKYDLEPFFFTAEAQYNKREYIYDISYTFPAFGRSGQDIQYSEYMNVINVPVSLGVDLGAVDVSSGFLPQLIVSQQSDLEGITGYSQKLKRLRLGWHTGLAVNINQLRVGVNWQMDFNNYVDHAYVREQSLRLQGRPTRVIGTVGYIF
jgi:hypothetical protein